MVFSLLSLSVIVRAALLGFSVTRGVATARLIMAENVSSSSTKLSLLIMMGTVIWVWELLNTSGTETSGV